MNQAFTLALARLTRRRFFRLFLGFLSNRLTPAGRGLLLVWVVSALQGSVSLEIPIYHVWAFTTVTLGVAWLLSWFAVPTLHLVRRIPHHVSAGEELQIEVVIENLSRRSARELTIAELDLPLGIHPVDEPGQTTVPRLEPGEKAVVRLRFHCTKRGAYTLRGLHVASAFPLNLWRRLRRSPQESSLLVYPAFTTPVAFPVPEGRQYQPGGFLLSSNVGESSDFLHTREYRAGDNPRHVHWTSWARLGKPIVKVYQEEYFVRLALVVDTEVPSACSDVAFEAGISAAAGIADYLSRRDYIIDLFAAGTSVYHFQAGRALAHFEHLLEILACLESTTRVHWEALAASMEPEMTRLTAVVAIFTDWTPERQAYIGRLRALGVGGRTIVIRQGDTSLPLPAMSPESFVHLSPGDALPGVAGV